MESMYLSRKRSRRRELADKLSMWALIIVGALGTLIGVVDMFGDVDQLLGFLPFAKDTSTMILLIVSLVAFASGLERYACLDEISESIRYGHSKVMNTLTEIQKVVKRQGADLEKQIEEVNQNLIPLIPTQPLGGRKQVYEEARRLIRACRGSEIIRATSLSLTSREDSEASDEHNNAYHEALAKKIGESKKGLGMVYKVVMGFGDTTTEVPPPSKQQGIRKRRARFKANGVLDRLEIKSLNTTWSLNVLIIGNKHMIVGFPTTAGDTDVSLGIRISNPKFVENARRWYDECLWQEAQDVTWTGEENIE